MLKWLTILLGTAGSLLRSRSQLALENLALRQQVALTPIGSSGRSGRAAGPAGEKLSTLFSPIRSSDGTDRDFAITGGGGAGHAVGRPSTPRCGL